LERAARMLACLGEQGEETGVTGVLMVVERRLDLGAALPCPLPALQEPA
jgi:hypothetical protein